MNDLGTERLPPGWATARLGDFVEVLDRFRVPVNSDERARRPGKVPYYGATGQVGWIDDFLFDEELVLLGEDGAPFLDPSRPKAYLIRGMAWVNNHAHVLRAKHGLLNAFLMYQLNQADFRPFVSGTTRLKLPQAPMCMMPLVAAPLPEQHRIVAEIEAQFTRLDAAVAGLELVRAKLKRYRAAVLKAACEGRLVPTEAEVAREEGREYEPAARLVDGIWQGGEVERNGRQDRLNQAMMPVSAEVPDGWMWATIGQIGRVQGGIQKQPKRAPRNNAYPFLRVANVLRGRLELREIHRVELFGNELSKLRLESGDLLIVEGNGSASEIGRMAIWNGAIGDCVHQNHIIRVRLADGIESKYVESYWNSPAGSDAVKRVASSTSGLYTLSVAKISRLSVPLPPAPEQRRIVAEVERRLSVIEEIEAVINANLKRAERMRQAVLKRAFEGKLVEQDPSDEPASVLLERIRAERSTRVRATARQRKIAVRQPRLL